MGWADAVGWKRPFDFPILQAAVRALAFKWMRILVRCWQERTPYDESVYLHALNRRGSSLIHNLAKGSEIP